MMHMMPMMHMAPTPIMMMETSMIQMNNFNPINLIESSQLMSSRNNLQNNFLYIVYEF